ncbi:hypothetical protein TWF481_002998 [Arthrobotrys musiformis]|uniref:Uncharacterized protein n=1 Tax=Arthrobotrys musiformis TaxID=47236 RepID=A0AAV9VS20_9PEZI
MRLWIDGQALRPENDYPTPEHENVDDDYGIEEEIDPVQLQQMEPDVTIQGPERNRLWSPVDAIGQENMNQLLETYSTTGSEDKEVAMERYISLRSVLQLILLQEESQIV